MYPDFKELLRVFNAHGVKYLIVGGYAVSLHAQPRATKDIDILVKPNAENAQATYAALAKFGAPLEGLAPEDFAEPGSFFRMGHEPVAVDLLSEIPGVDFDSAWEKRVDAVIDPASGLTAHFISGDDLMAAKLAAGRPQDIADAAAIHKAAEGKVPLSANKTPAETKPSSHGQ
jgi:Nucleotidyl transferase of unknown function (DUF2204)